MRGYYDNIKRKGESMSDISVSDADTFVLVKELLERKTDNGTVLFRENSITLEDNTVQLLGLVANVQMTLTPPSEEE